MQHIFIIGSKGIPSNYGGYETFLDKLIEYHQNNSNLKYHVACKNTGSKEFEYYNARCFNIKVPNIGAAQAIYYDVFALNDCCKYIVTNKIKNLIVYILACRIGPFAAYFQRKIHKLGGKVFVNPDGHEWMRAKWSVLVRKYWKVSEQMMVKRADLLICDSKNIEKYIQESYKKYSPKTTFIAYGAEIKENTSMEAKVKLLNWYEKNNLSEKEYYLVVGRFVPENNYEIMIREFMKSNSKKDFVLITNVSDKFLTKLKSNTGFNKDMRIKFVGTVYDQELLMQIRKNAYCYLHGHEVGGTNPSLLEALGNTNLNLLLDVGFNREVGENSSLYWSKKHGELADLIDKVDQFSEEEIKVLGAKAKKRIAESYSWEYISQLYEGIFLEKR